jgi:hypothetical protein
MMIDNCMVNPYVACHSKRSEESSNLVARHWILRYAQNDGVNKKGQSVKRFALLFN